MKIVKTNLLILSLLSILLNIYPSDTLAKKNIRFFGQDLLNDLKYFYSFLSLKAWSLGLAGSALFSYTSIDNSIAKAYQRYVRGPRSDFISEKIKPLGDWKKTWPFYFACSVFDYVQWEKQPRFLRIIGSWGSRSSRALLLGWPCVALFQRVIGSDRPYTGDSRWHPFKYASGVSGHVFVGAIPFLAASEVTDNVWIKGIFIAGSTSMVVSRINDNKHYTSQAVLGWLAAWLSLRAISKTENNYKKSDLNVIFYGNRIELSYQF